MKVCRQKEARISLALLLAVTLLTVAPGLAGANGAPVTIFLSYLPGVSNWGPTDATGTAVVAVGDGEVSLEVDGLPRLTEEHYEVWLESREERKLYSVGKFNANAEGVGRLSVLLDTLPYQEYRMLLISVEPEPDPSLEPDERRSLAGLFPNQAIVQLLGPLGTATPGMAPPQYLPETGHAHDQLRSAGLAAVIGLLSIGMALALLVDRRTRRNV